MWKDIKNHEDYYEINQNGEVRNKKTGKIIVGDKNNCGYMRVCLYMPYKKRYFRHRLVAEHFIPNLENKKYVNHIDGNKENNTITNLEWSTQSENEKHAYANGLKSKKEKVLLIYDTGDSIEFDSMGDCAEYLNCTISNLSVLIKNNTFKGKKYRIVKL